MCHCLASQPTARRRCRCWGLEREEVEETIPDPLLVLQEAEERRLLRVEEERLMPQLEEVERLMPQEEVERRLPQEEVERCYLVVQGS